ncbi:hypothetical protein SV7mr_46140 [Stieleria bergensis]|uniref:Uncharacterized protein n=1 Tax=Stieleria bergensis TaxID=2528025 RepID=A0A517T163_9BACT|nr:hypothetical protein SV7mr_46140 [Planctomycetes bacterium SV_7m_r]
MRGGEVYANVFDCQSQLGILLIKNLWRPGWRPARLFKPMRFTCVFSSSVRVWQSIGGVWMWPGSRLLCACEVVCADRWLGCNWLFSPRGSRSIRSVAENLCNSTFRWSNDFGHNANSSAAPVFQARCGNSSGLCDASWFALQFNETAATELRTDFSWLSQFGPVGK